MTKSLLGLSASVVVLTLAALATQASAQTANTPNWAPMTPTIAAPKDVPYSAGTIKLSVDATDTAHRIIRIHEVIPVASGPVTLLAPKWLPGDHEPDGESDKMAGFVFTAGGQTLAWQRDPVATNAFHVTVPDGVNELKVDFQYLAPVAEDVGRIVMTPDMVNIQWDFASMYPAGYYVSRIPVAASLKLPAGYWQLGTGLDQDNTSADNTVTFKPTTYETLIDSPVFAGVYFKRLDLDPGASVPVHMDIVADHPESLVVPDDVLKIHQKLVQQAYKLYGAHHYDHYDFLVAASDNLGGIGLEHHRSSENSVDTEYFTDWKTKFVGRDLFAHEYTHSWNGKFRRPWDLWTPDYQVPMRDSLLWVYEGQTEYWGNVLAARSGLFSKDQYLGHIASIAAYYNSIAARQWRPLQDTTNDPIIAQREAQSWPTWQRSEDYYDEGLLIWLDADTLIRDKTGGKKSLDDFAHAFFGIDNGEWNTVTYNFDDVVKALNDVYAYDWATFLRSRLDSIGKSAPMDGLTRAGYKLVYTDSENDYFKAREAYHKFDDLSYGLGIYVGHDGALKGVAWDSPAFKAGLTSGMQIVAVNGFVFDSDKLKDTIKAAGPGKDGKAGAPGAIEFIVKENDRYKVVKIDYHDGLRYPNLVPIDAKAKTTMLDAILAEKK